MKKLLLLIFAILMINADGCGNGDSITFGIGPFDPPCMDSQSVNGSCNSCILNNTDNAICTRELTSQQCQEFANRTTWNHEWEPYYACDYPTMNYTEEWDCEGGNIGDICDVTWYKQP